MWFLVGLTACRCLLLRNALKAWARVGRTPAWAEVTASGAERLCAEQNFVRSAALGCINLSTFTPAGNKRPRRPVNMISTDDTLLSGASKSEIPVYQSLVNADVMCEPWLGDDHAADLDEDVSTLTLKGSVTMRREQLSMAAAVLGVLLLAGPAAAGPASMLNASEASAFMGTWVISMEGPRGGTRDQNVTIRDEGGKVAARLGRARGGPIDVTDIAKDGDSLVLRFERSDRGGNTRAVVVTLRLDGEMINATQDIGGGQFSISGSGKKW